MNRIKLGGKVFRDPIHQLIRIAPGDDVLLELIDTPEFQRMRRIRQLGVSWLTYHGAEHSRFSHSLGVFNFAQRIIAALQERYGHGDKVSRKLQSLALSIKAAALLHDIGHGPFSHLFEHAFDCKKDHETWTREICMSDATAVGKLLKKHLDAGDIASIIAKDFREKFVVDIISSQLDADRMDYLLRDSYYTGVAYGEYDISWLLHAMCLASVGKNGSHYQNLCLDDTKGVYAAERFVIARLHMYQQVYMHRVTRGFEILLHNLFSAAAYCAARNKLPSETPPLVRKYFKKKGDLELGEYLSLDESQLVAACHVWAGSTSHHCQTIARLARAFLNRERIYAAVPIDTHDTAKILKLTQRLNELEFESDGQTQTWGLDPIEDTAYKGMLYRVDQGKGPEEIVNQSILIATADSDGSARPVESKSALLKDMADKKFELARLYYDRSRKADFEPIFRDLGLKPATEVTYDK